MRFTLGDPKALHIKQTVELFLIFKSLGKLHILSIALTHILNFGAMSIFGPLLSLSC